MISIRFYNFIVPALLTFVSAELPAQQKSQSIDSGALKRHIISSPLMRIDKKADSLSITEMKLIDRNLYWENVCIDSVTALNMPTTQYEHKLDSISKSLRRRLSYHNTLDSLSGWLRNNASDVLSRQDSVRKEVNARAEKFQSSIKRKSSFLDSIAMKNPNGGKVEWTDDVNKVRQSLANQARLPGNPITLPKGHFPNNSEKLQLPPVNLNQSAKLPDLGLGQELQTIQKEVNTVKGATNKVKEYEKDISQIKEGNVEKVKSVPKELENAAGNVAELKELKGETQQLTKVKNSLEQYQAMMEEMNSKKPSREDAEKLAKRELQDHFANEQTKLKAGIAELDRLKKKYHTIPDSRYLPKHAPNIMRGKSFRERIVPVLSFQSFSSKDVLIDFQPTVAYKVSGRLRPGLGGSYRVEASSKSVSYAKVYGFRVFNDYRFIGSNYFRVEAEWMNIAPSVWSRYSFPVDPVQKEWRFRLNAGVVKTYPISKRFAGQAAILYNVADLTRFPSSNNTSLRFGFEYKFKIKNR